MSNLSDNEIIKALECYVSEQCDCDDCPINDYCREHSDEMIKKMLVLINRLKAENERLKQERDKEHDSRNHYMRMCAKAHIEGAKEFAEKLLRKATFMRDEESINGVVRVADIYETLEETGVCDEQTV